MREDNIINEKEKRRLDPKCWKGYHKAGTKKKGDIRVNKCVKNEATKVNREEKNDREWMDMFFKFFYYSYRNEIEQRGGNPYEEWVDWYSPFYDEWVIKDKVAKWNSSWGKEHRSSIDVNELLKVINQKRQEKESQ